MAPPSWAFEYSPSVADGGGAWATAGASALAILTIAAFICWAVVGEAIKKYNKSVPDGASVLQLFAGGRSEPLSLSAASLYALSREFSRIGAILLITFLCEHYPLFPHEAKQKDMDFFWFLTAALFLAAATTMKKSKTTDLLHREQTEEWKGWMQYMFLLYHYLSAENVYNAIRVMITAYVWMTGFGNFSFFYLKGDFGAVRVLQMLWRLNFLVIMLMLVHGNTYILYYICPLHTFYFLMTYVVMRVGAGMNRKKWAIRGKIFVCAVLIYIIWDTDLGLFDALFSWVGTVPRMGGVSGTEYEWYFRTSLDHFSTVLGMVFALNYPVSNAFFTVAGEMPSFRKHLVLGGGCVCAVGALVYWLLVYYSLPKLQYNATNAYMAPVALLSYVFLRNVVPEFRAWHSSLLHDIGKTTLETYLLQHHIWLTSNAKTLLVLVPGMPKVNFVLTSCLFIMFAKECYRVTMSLRGMFLPDGNAYACFRNLIVLSVLFAMALGAGGIVVLLSSNRLETQAIIMLLGVVLAVSALTFLDLVKRQGPRIMSEFLPLAPKLAALGALLVIAAQVWGPSVDRPVVDGAVCVDAVQDGSWIYRQHVSTIDCVGPTGVDQSGNPVAGWMALEEQTASCELLAWQWHGRRSEAAGCGFRMMDQKRAQARVPEDLRVAVVGDSEARKVYYGLRNLFFNEPIGVASYHADMTPFESGRSNMQIAFYWKPRIEDAHAKITELYSSSVKPDVVVIASTLWDTLYAKSLDEYTKEARDLADEIGLHQDTVHIFVQPPKILDGLLNSDEKRKYMTERIVAAYRHANKVELSGEVDLLIRLDELTKEPFSQQHSLDGVHYFPIYYDVVVQQIVNALPYAAEGKGLEWKYPGNSSRETGGMRNPSYGLGVLIAIVVMLVTYDAFGGYTFLGALFFGTSELKQAMTYDKAYGPILSKIEGAQPKSSEAIEQSEAGQADEKVPLVESEKV